jgi:hypothetical protein
MPCSQARPFWIPWSTWSVTGALPSGYVTGGLQVQPRVPNELGSALAGAATPNAVTSAIAVPSKTLVITNGSHEVRFSSVQAGAVGCGHAPECRGQNAAMLTPTKNPAW